jgi:signal peptidase I
MPSEPEAISKSATQSPAQSWWASQKDNLQVVVIALILAFLLRTFIIEPRFIPSGSMEPTLQVGDRIVVEKISYRWNPPQRGQIIVFYPPFADQDGEPKAYIKRIVGLPGDRLNIHDGKVFLNDKALTEPYIAEEIAYILPNPALGIKEITVPPNQLWVMGDNRNNSNDSHVWGFLPQSNIVGRAIFRFFPLDRYFGLLPQPQYPNVRAPMSNPSS